MAQHIGIVACSAEGAALCYRTVCVEGARLMGAHNHPEVSLHTHALAEYMKFIDQRDWQGRGGADAFFCRKTGERRGRLSHLS
jgi:aspartate racemase